MFLKIAQKKPGLTNKSKPNCRYLLDTLHEQEKSAKRGSSTTTYLHTTPTPSVEANVSSNSKLLSPNSQGRGLKPIQPAEADETETLETSYGKVKPSFSTTALDSISEDPENGHGSGGGGGTNETNEASFFSPVSFTFGEEQNEG